jgi:hypothetical protein
MLSVQALAAEPTSNTDLTSLSTAESVKRISKKSIDAKKPVKLPLPGKKTISVSAKSLKYYKFTLSNPSKVSMLFTGADIDRYTLKNLTDTDYSNIGLFALYAPKKAALLFDDYIEGGLSDTFKINKYWYLPKGTYYLRIDNSSFSSKATFKVTTKITRYKTLSDTVTIDPAIGFNADGMDYSRQLKILKKRGKAIKLNKTYSGFLATKNNSDISSRDLYKITLTKPTNISINVSNYRNYLLVYDGRTGKAINFQNFDVKPSHSLYLSKGTYYVYNMGVDEGKYSIRVSTGGPKLSTKFVGKKLKLEWTGVSGADKYEVWRSADYLGKFKKIATVNKKARSYVTSLPKYDGTRYHYKVRALDGGKPSIFSETFYAYWT